MSAYEEFCKDAIEQLGMEAALLIASAKAKGIDPSVWLHVEENEGFVPVEDFNNRLVSLGAAVGIQEDIQTKKELQLATSVSSLNTILSLCGSSGKDDEDDNEIDETPLPFINTALFLYLCEEKIDDFLNIQTRILTPNKEDNSQYDNTYNYSASPKKKGILVSEEVSLSSQKTMEGEVEFHGSDPSHNYGIGMELHRNEHRDSQDDQVLLYNDEQLELDDAEDAEVELEVSGEQEVGLHVREHRLGFETGSPTLSLRSSEEGDEDGNTSYPKISNVDPLSQSHSSMDRTISTTTHYNHYSNGHGPEMNLNVETEPGLGLGATAARTQTRMRGGRYNVAGGGNGTGSTMVQPASQARKKLVSTTRRTKLRHSTGNLQSHNSHDNGITTVYTQKKGDRDTGVSVSVTVAPTKPMSTETLQQHVEYLVFNTVRKPELYHILRVKLGLFNGNKPYTILPARGPIIFSPKITNSLRSSSNAGPHSLHGIDEWISVKDLQRIFEGIMLKLSDLHIVLLMKLIVIFATQCQQGKLRVSSSIMNELINKENTHNGVIVAEIPKVIMNKDGLQYVNTYWLSKYLGYIRISKTISSPMNSRAGSLKTKKMSESRCSLYSSVSRSMSPQINNDIGNSAETLPNANPLVSHEVWCMNKRNQKKELKEDKNDLFKAVLSGRRNIVSVNPSLRHANGEFESSGDASPHKLTKSELNELLLKFDIIPSDLLEQEVTLRKDYWYYDCGGRKDFLHTLHVALHKHKTANPSIWKKMSASDRNEWIAKTSTELCNAKMNELQHLEKTEAHITKELFWKYHHYIVRLAEKSTPLSWGKWLRQIHLANFARTIQASKADMEDRERIQLIMDANKSKVAPLNVVESKLIKASQNLSAYHQREIRTKLLEMRKNATFNSSIYQPLPTFDSHGVKKAPPVSLTGANKPQWMRCKETGNATHGLLVTKEEYDAVLKDVLAAPSTHKTLKSSKLEGDLVDNVDYVVVKKYTTRAAQSGAVSSASESNANMQLVAGFDEEIYKVDGVDQVFKKDVNEAFQISLEEEMRAKELKQMEFKLWKENKDEIIRQHKEKIVSFSKFLRIFIH